METTQDPGEVFYSTDAEPDYSVEPDYTEEPDYSVEPDYTEAPDYSVEPDYTEEPDYYSDEPGFTPGIATPGWRDSFLSKFYCHLFFVFCLPSQCQWDTFKFLNGRQL